MGGYHIGIEELQTLDRHWRKLYREYSIPMPNEIKHSALCMRCCGIQPKDPDEAAHKCLAHLSADDARGLLQCIVDTVGSFDSLRIIVAAGRPQDLMSMPSIADADIHRWTRKTSREVRCIAMFLQNLMQRFEMDLRIMGQEGQMHFDRISPKAHTVLQEYHAMLVRGKGDAFVKYRKLLQLLDFQENDSSWPLHLADHVCGLCAGFLNGDPAAAASLELIWDKLRTDRDGVVAGCGIIGIPAGRITEDLLRRLRSGEQLTPQETPSS